MFLNAQNVHKLMNQLTEDKKKTLHEREETKLKRRMLNAMLLHIESTKPVITV